MGAQDLRKKGIEKMIKLIDKTIRADLLKLTEKETANLLEKTYFNNYLFSELLKMYCRENAQDFENVELKICIYCPFGQIQVELFDNERNYTTFYIYFSFDTKNLEKFKFKYWNMEITKSDTLEVNFLLQLDEFLKSEECQELFKEYEYV